MAASVLSLSFPLVCLVVILGAFSPASNAADIPPDYHSYPELNVAYKVHPEMKTWADAREACISEGANLAIIDNMLKVAKVAELKEFNVYVWVGISRTGAGAPWRSAGNNSVMANLPWAPDKPEGPHNCLAVRGCNRGVTNEDCATSFGFVCQLLIEEPDVVIEAEPLI